MTTGAECQEAIGFLRFDADCVGRIIEPIVYETKTDARCRTGRLRPRRGGAVGWERTWDGGDGAVPGATNRPCVEFRPMRPMSLRDQEAAAPAGVPHSPAPTAVPEMAAAHLPTV